MSGMGNCWLLRKGRCTPCHWPFWMVSTRKVMRTVTSTGEWCQSEWVMTVLYSSQDHNMPACSTPISNSTNHFPYGTVLLIWTSQPLLPTILDYTIFGNLISPIKWKCSVIVVPWSSSDSTNPFNVCLKHSVQSVTQSGVGILLHSGGAKCSIYPWL